MIIISKFNANSSMIQIYVEMVTGHNGHKPKRPQPKRPQTETATNQKATNRDGHGPKRPQTGAATKRNGHKPKRPQTETITDQNGYKPKRPQTGAATNRNGHISCHPSVVTRINMMEKVPHNFFIESRIFVCYRILNKCTIRFFVNTLPCLMRTGPLRTQWGKISGPTFL